MKIEVVLHATSVGIEEAATATLAIEKQLREHVAPAWGMVAPTVILSRGEEPRDPEACPLVIFDDADQANALGYHDVDGSGRAYGKVFAKTTKDNGGNWTTTFSHEACEMFIDPSCQAWDVGTDGRLHAREVCDATEADEYSVSVGDGEAVVTVSNYLWPAYFNPASPAGTKFDHLGLLIAPSPEKRPGGYSIDADISNESNSFAKNVAAFFHELFPAWKRAIKDHPASRTSRRARC